MRKRCDSTIFLGVVAALFAGTIVMTTAVPAAQAQGADSPATAAPAAQPATPPTPAQKAAAGRAYKAGQKAYDKADFALAAQEFKKADETIPSPQAKYWYAVALDKADPSDANVKEKVAAYNAYISSDGSGSAGPGLLEQATARVAELKAKVPSVVKLSSLPAGAQVSVDGAPQAGNTPMELTLSAGKHRIAVTAEGYLPKEVELTVEGMQEIEQNIELEVEPPPPPTAPAAAPPEPPATPPPPPPKQPSKAPAYVTLGIAGVGAIVGTAFGVMALGKKKDFDDNPTNKNADEVERDALISDMAFGVAITLGVTGVVLLTSKEEAVEAQLRRLPARAKLQLAPYVGPTGGGAAARVTF